MTQYRPGERAVMLTLFAVWLALPFTVWFFGGAFVYWDIAWADELARKQIAAIQFWWVVFWVWVAVLA